MDNDQEPEHPEADSQRRALDAVLRRLPEAHVAAIGWEGIFVDMPEGVPLGDGHRPLGGRTVIDLAMPGSYGAVLDAWESVKAGKVSQCELQLRADPTRVVLVRWFDVTAAYGVYIAVVTPVGAASSDRFDSVPAMPIVPRIARVRKDAAAVLTEVDAATLQIFGFAREEMEGVRSIDFVHPDDHPVAVDAWLEMLGTRAETQRVRLRHRQADGTYRWMELSNENRLGTDGTGDVVTEMLDISDEMAAQEALRAREQLLDRLAQALPLGIIQFNLDQEIVYTNERTADVTGVDNAVTVSEQLARVVPEDEEFVRSAVEAILSDGSPSEIEIQLEIDGRRRVCNVRLRSLTEAQGAISGAIMAVADITESAAMRKELHVRATFDSLTGCHNRESTMTALEQCLRDPAPGLAVVYLDLDHFKGVNDSFGHHVGDAVLRSLATQLHEAVREHDIVGRLGGDEFMIICPRTPSVEAAQALAERFAEVARHQVDADGHIIDVSATTGPAWTADAGLSADDLVALADAAMYEEKNRRKAEEAKHRSDPIAESEAAILRRALADNEFELAFQPIMELSSDRVWGVEALLRWRRGVELLAAGSFLPTAEKTGVIVDLGRWIIDELCREIVAATEGWQRDLVWFLNLTSAELVAGADAYLLDALAAAAIDPTTIVVEISERADLEQHPAAVDAIHRLAAGGVSIGLDDFGTGYSSLVRLRELPLSWLKVDYGFTKAETWEHSTRMLSAVRELAEAMELEVIVEGVESEDHRNALADLGVDRAQGYLFQAAMPLGELFPVRGVSSPGS